jgi:hypothetical protein
MKVGVFAETTGGALWAGCTTIPEAIENYLTNSEFLRWHRHHILTARFLCLQNGTMSSQSTARG